MNDMIRQMVQFYDIEYLKKKGLYDENDFSDKFFKLYINYKILLEKYLLKKLSLKEFDNKIVNSEFKFSPVMKENMDIYQLLSVLNLKYVYLRNNLNVDKLSIQDIELVVNLNDSNLSKPSDELFSFIERTYKDVLDANRENNDVRHMVCYGKDTDYFWKDSRDLVFGVRQDEFVDNGLGEEDEWLDNYFGQMQFLGNLFNEYETKYSSILEINVKFLYYDDVSVKKSMSK